MLDEPQLTDQAEPVTPVMPSYAPPPAYEALPASSAPAPKRDHRLRGLTLMLIIGLVLGAVVGGVSGGLIARSTLQAQATASASKPNNVPIVAVASTRATGDSSQAVVAAVQRVGPAVVTVVNTMPQQQVFGFFGDSVQQPKASGSGVIISPQGYIVTNNHVVDGYQTLQVI